MSPCESGKTTKYSILKKQSSSGILLYQVLLSNYELILPWIVAACHTGTMDNTILVGAGRQKSSAITVMNDK